MTGDQAPRAASRAWNKVFCIGLNKTGTSSLHAAFQRLGLRSLHFVPDSIRSSRDQVEWRSAFAEAVREARRVGEPLLYGYDDYDAYSDVGPVTRHFDVLDRQYPGSRFIYTDRDVDEWIASRTKHVLRNRVRQEQGLYAGTFLEVEPERWRESWHEHRQRVDAHFAGRPDLLILNIPAGDGYKLLCPFLGLDVPSEPFPWRHRARS